MAKEKIIFLDFDGVLNTEYYQAQLLRQGSPCKDENGMFFDPEAVAQLKRVVDETNADIVIESSWKYLGLEAMHRLWKSRAMPGQLIGMTSSSVSDEWLLNSDLEDFDSHVRQCKGIEIASWLTENVAPNTQYVIIDDDDDDVCLANQLSHFIPTDPYDGLTEELASRAICILNKKS